MATSFWVTEKNYYLHSWDLIGNPALGIVDALKGIADSLPVASSGIVVAYLEVYGGKVTAASSQYTAKQSVGLRLFDVAVLTDTDIEMLFALTCPATSSVA